jgi:hypothetical protein
VAVDGTGSAASLCLVAADRNVGSDVTGFRSAEPRQTERERDSLPSFMILY